jgi:hypothetical protein
MIEAFAIIEVDFSRGAIILGGESAAHQMLDTLVQEVRRRNPSLMQGA